MEISTGTSDRLTAFAAVTEKGKQWVVDPSCRHLIPDALEALLHPRASGGSRVIRENRVRRSMLIRLPQDRETIFAKLYKRPSGVDRIKYFFFPSKASAEWKAMIHLCERGLPVARPLARGEKRRRGWLEEAYLFTRALEGAVPLSTYAAGHHAFPRTKRLTEQTARLVSEIHRQGFFFRDLHAGNLLIAPAADDGCRMYLVDFHKVWRTGWVPLRMRVRDLAQLHNSLAVSRTVRLRFLRDYLRHAHLPPGSFRDVARRIDHKAARMWNTHLRSRTKRCLKESSEFSISVSGNGTTYRNRAFPEPLIDALIAYYEQASQDNLRMLKKSPKETVSVLTATHDGAEYSVVIKESFFTTFLSRLRNTIFRSRARRNWIGARALRVRGIATPEAMALIEYRTNGLVRRTLLLTRYVDRSYELNDYVLSRYDRELSAAELLHKKRFITALAGLIRDMHEKGIYHGDLKSNNILVREEGDAWKLYVVDLDRIRFRPALSFKERANNLAQINASVAGCITPADRIRFFKHYARGSASAREGKHYARRIMEIGRKKNTRPYGLVFKEP